MKTTSQITSPANSATYKIIIIAIIILLSAVAAFADNYPGFGRKYKNMSKRKPNYGANINKSNRPVFAVSTGAMVTGSQLGHREEINFSVRMNRSSLEVGTFAGYNKKVASGVNLRFKWFATKEDYLNIFLFGNVIYDSKAVLGTMAEHSLYKGMTDYTKPTFNSVEEYLGFGLSTKITSNISLDGSLGFGLYQSEVNNGVEMPLDNEGIRDNVGIGLSLQIGLVIKL